MLSSPRKNYFQKGFIDILSFLILGFLITSLLAVTFVLSNKDFTANFFGQAKSQADIAASKAKQAAEAAKKQADEDKKKAATQEKQAQKQAETAANTNNGPKGSYGKLSDSQRASIDFDTYKNNVNNGIPVPTPITQVASAPAGSCDSNGTPYSEGSVVVFGGADYRKCVGGSWTTDSNLKITDLTTVPVYLKPEFDAAVVAKTKESQPTQPLPQLAPHVNPDITNPVTDFTQVKITCETNGGFWNSTLNICGQGQGNCESFGGTWDGTKCSITKCVAKIENLGCQSGCRLERTTNVDCTVTTSCVAAVGCSPATNTTTAQSPAYSCPANYIVAQNEYGANYCKENILLPNKKNDGSFCSDNSECNSGQCGVVFLGLKTCHPPEAIPSIQTIAAQKNSKPLGETCNKGSECGTGSCASSWTSTDGSTTFSTKGNICTYTQAEQNSFLNAQSNRDTQTVTSVAQGALLYSGINQLPGAISSIGNVGSSIWNIAGGNLANVPTALYIYGTNTLATLPAAAQTGLSALTVGGTAYAGYDCINGGDPNSPSCTGLIGGYYADPLGFNQALNQSGNNLKTATVNKINQLADPFAGINVNFSNTDLNNTTTLTSSVNTWNNSLNPNINLVLKPSGVLTPQEAMLASKPTTQQAIQAYGQILSNGKYGTTFLSSDGQVVTKLFNDPSRAVSEMQNIEQFGGQATLPNFYQYVPGGYQMEAIPGIKLGNQPGSGGPNFIDQYHVTPEMTQQIQTAIQQFQTVIGVAHGDLRPWNILIQNPTTNPTVRLIDPFFTDNPQIMIEELNNQPWYQNLINNTPFNPNP